MALRVSVAGLDTSFGAVLPLQTTIRGMWMGWKIQWLSLFRKNGCYRRMKMTRISHFSFSQRDLQKVTPSNLGYIAWYVDLGAIDKITIPWSSSSTKSATKSLFVFPVPYIFWSFYCLNFVVCLCTYLGTFWLGTKPSTTCTKVLHNLMKTIMTSHLG